MARDRLNRREFLKQSTAAAAALAAGLGTKPAYAGRKNRPSGYAHKKVIILGIDGMDPVLSERLMNAGLLPNFDKLRKMGGYSRLGTSNPPQSPVAWANFITGAGPGTHGIFDFFHRDPKNGYELRHAISHVESGKGVIGVGDHLIQLNFWPFNHSSPRTVPGRKGVAFWDYLDQAGIASHIYSMPSNYPPSPSEYGRHFSLSGLGTPDITGALGAYQYFDEGGPQGTIDVTCHKHSGLTFENGTAEAYLFGPKNIFLKEPEPAKIEFLIHRDRQADSAVIEIQGQRILLKEGQWSDWIKLSFKLSMPIYMPYKPISGICRFCLRQVGPKLRLYASPININPADPVMQISEPADFSEKISKKLGLFPTIGFQEDYSARMNEVLDDQEYAQLADLVLQQRLELLEYALENYEDGVLFFYFSSTDLQAHIFWWDSFEKHPFRSRKLAVKYHNRIKQLYRRMDSVLGDILKRFGDKATVIALSDHGFANFKRQFNTNTWLMKNGYLPYCTTLYPQTDQTQLRGYEQEIGVDWSKARAYALGINSLYLNLEGREEQGIVKPAERESLLDEIAAKLEAVRDVDGKPVIRKVYRTDQIYSGPQMEIAPDLIIGYHRGYRCDGQTIQGVLAKEILRDLETAWTADHCFDPREVPGVLFCNRPIRAESPSLIDLAPAILAEYGLSKPDSMEGNSVFAG